MLHFESIWRAFAWLLLSALFGLASLLLILAASAIFSYHVNEKLIDDNAIMFLCIALMSGAGIDFLLSCNHHFGLRLSAFLFVILAAAIAFFILSPNNANKPHEDTLNTFAGAYGVVTAAFCIILKTLIIYRERLSKEKLKFLN